MFVSQDSPVERKDYYPAMTFSVSAAGAHEVLGLFAHPDDEVFCLGGTMAKHVAAGGCGKIVSLTQGEAGQIRDVAVGSRRTLGDVRSRELAQACAELGVTDAECLQFGDGTLADLPIEPLVEAVTSIIADFEPDVVISFGPDGATGHPDHIVTADIARQAAEASKTHPTILRAVFPRQSNFLIRLIVDWLGNLDSRFMGTEEFAHGLMLFADGSSMLGYAADHLAVRFYPAGTFIIEQGEPSGDLYLVLAGTVDIVQEDTSGALNKVASSGPGSFIGEDGIANGQPRNAHVVANDSVTCFVLSPTAATASDGRGPSSPTPDNEEELSFVAAEPGYIAVDVREFAEQKMRALTCHRSQYAIGANMFPRSLIEGIFGTEYFARV